MLIKDAYQTENDPLANLLAGHTAYETGMSLLPSALLSAASFVIVGPLSQKTDACGLSLGFLFIPMTVASLGGLKSSEIGEESASAGSRHC